MQAINRKLDLQLVNHSIFIIFSIIFSFFCSINSHSLDYSRLIERFILNTSLPDWGVYLLLDWLIYIGFSISFNPRVFFFILILIVLLISLNNIVKGVGQKATFLFLILFTIFVPPGDFVHLLKQNVATLFLICSVFTDNKMRKKIFMFASIGFHSYIIVFYFLMYFSRNWFFKNITLVKAILILIFIIILQSLDMSRMSLDILKQIDLPRLSARLYEYRIDRWGELTLWKIYLLIVSFCGLYFFWSRNTHQETTQKLVFLVLTVVLIASFFSGYDILEYRMLVYAKLPALLGLCIVLRPRTWRINNA